MADYEKFSPAVINLQQELASGYHTTLCQVLALCQDMEERMSALATHCDILVDDKFDQRKFDDLCDEISKRLVDKREPKPSLITVPWQ